MWQDGEPRTVGPQQTSSAEPAQVGVPVTRPLLVTKAQSLIKQTRAREGLVFRDAGRYKGGKDLGPGNNAGFQEQNQ